MTRTIPWFVEFGTNRTVVGAGSLHRARVRPQLREFIILKCAMPDGFVVEELLVINPLGGGKFEEVYIADELRDGRPCAPCRGGEIEIAVRNVTGKPLSCYGSLLGDALL